MSMKTKLNYTYLPFIIISLKKYIDVSVYNKLTEVKNNGDYYAHYGGIFIQYFINIEDNHSNHQT